VVAYLAPMLQKPSTVPAFTPPQTPMLSAKPAGGAGWIHEVKYDGYRTLVRLDGSQAQAFSRNGYDWTDKYQGVIEACRKLSCRSALIDGEIIVQDANGVSDFAALRAAIHREPHRLVMFAFDLLFIDGEDVRRLPLVERRAKLHRLIPLDNRVQLFSSATTMMAMAQCYSNAPVTWD
jgi:bifunctional non-homologous end joining protein LigD